MNKQLKKYWIRSITHLLFLTLLSSAVIGQSGLNDLVNSQYENEDLNYILNNLSKRYDVDIRFNRTLLPSDKFTFSFKDMPLRDVLTVVLAERQLDYVEYAKEKIIIVPKSLLSDEESNDNTLSATTEISTDEPERLINLGQSVGANENSVHQIIGLIQDSLDFSAVEAALVFNLTTGDYTTSNIDGQFKLELNEGQYRIRITTVAHETYTARINVKGDAGWAIMLEPKAYFIDEVVVSTVNTAQKIDETITGLEALSKTDIKQLSSFMGEADVIKSLLTLPGVTNSGDGSSGLNIRGGSVDQNLILHDGVPIYNSSHVLGFFSTFNPDIVREVSLHKGHIPAYYGGRASSVLDVEIREADNKNFRVSGGVGLISSKLSADIPIQKGVSSLLVSGRTSYAGWLLGNVDNIDVQRSNAQFYDYNAKYAHQLSTKTKLIGSYFQSFDRFRFSNEFGYSWRNQIASGEIKHLINDRFSFSAILSYSSIKNSQFEPEGPLAFDLTSGLDNISAKAQVLYTPTNHTVRAGIDWIRFNSFPEELSPIDESQIKREEVAKENGQELGVYINDQIKLSEQLSIDVGLRFSLFQQLGPAIVNTYEQLNFFDVNEIVTRDDITNSNSIITYNGLEPRASLKYSLTDDLSFKVSYNRLYQYVHLLSNRTTPTPVDLWQVSNTHIRPLKSDNFSVGFFSRFNDQLNITFDTYYRKLDNTIDHRDFADLLLNPNLETAILLGEGRAYGSEFSLEQKTDKVAVRFSYSYSRSEHRTNKTDIETINNGDWFRSNFDQPHAVKLFFNWQISRRDRININFNYSTGRPITAPTSNFLVQDAIVPNFSARNALRLPSYHRLDFAYTFTFNRRKFVKYKSDLTIAFYNFYARKNSFSIFYRQQEGSAVNALSLSVVGTIIPSITYNFQF